MQIDRFNRRDTAAFTLVELLVAISIIAIIGALIAAGIMSWIGAQARRNTETEIRTLNKALLQHWDSVVRAAKKEKTIPTPVITMADGDADRAHIIWIKIRLMEAFPVNFSEIKNAYAAPPLSYIPGNRRFYMGKYSSDLPPGYVATTPGKTESAACLLMALKTNRDGVVHSEDLLKPFIRDTNNDKVSELVDGWGEPLYFYRFATGNADMQSKVPGNFVAPTLDPLDPRGLLIKTFTPGNTALFEKLIHPLKSGTNAWWAVPAIVSSGPNLVSGLVANTAPPYQNMAVATPKDADDNVYSYKIN
jgi:prepilin-type N-terminal cleavage/methylation domain-containing protein